MVTSIRVPFSSSVEAERSSFGMGFGLGWGGVETNCCSERRWPESY